MTNKKLALRVVTISLGALVWTGCEDLYADPIIGTYSGYDDSDASALPPGAGPLIPLTPTSGGDPLCPSQRPYDGVSCAGGQASFPVCEYGSNVDAWCNTRVDCQTGKWRTVHEPPTCEPCPAGDQVIEGAACGPPTDAVDGGDAGSPPPDRLCGYPKRTCACTGGASPRWVCTDTPKDCPAARPLEGQPCTVQQTCDYGACISPLGRTMTCTGTVWAIAEIQCL